MTVFPKVSVMANDVAAPAVAAAERPAMPEETTVDI